MALSSTEREAIAQFDHATVRGILIDYGWDAAGVSEDSVTELWDSNDHAELSIPIYEKFDGVKDEDFVVSFAKSLGINIGKAIALLSGKQTTIFEWHDPGKLPPVNVPLIVEIDGHRRAAEFDGDTINFVYGDRLRRGGFDDLTRITAIAWEVESGEAIT